MCGSLRGRDLKRGGEGAWVQHKEAHTRSSKEGQVPEDAPACHHPTESLVHDSPLSFPAS